MIISITITYITTIVNIITIIIIIIIVIIIAPGEALRRLAGAADLLASRMRR